MASVQIEQLMVDSQRMDFQSESARLLFRRKVGEIVGLLWGLGSSH
jgi:hypothetical protein